MDLSASLFVPPGNTDEMALLTDAERTEMFWFEEMSSDDVLEWLSDKWVTTYRNGAGALQMISIFEKPDLCGGMAIHVIAPQGAGLRRVDVVGAASLGVSIAFGAPRVRRLVATPAEDNRAAVRLAEAVGFKREGRLRKALYLAGEYRDLAVLALLREEWGGACLQQ